MKAAGPLARLSLRRFSSRKLRTGLSVLAVAAGVAFVFAIQAINLSPEASFRELESALAGDVDRYLVARTQDGVPNDVFSRVSALDQVQVAAPITQHLVRIESERGTARVGLIGVDRRLKAFDPPAAEAALLESRDVSSVGLHLPPPVADRLQVQPGDRVTVRYGARVESAQVAGVLSGESAERLRNVSVALAPLGVAQRLTHSSGRISRVLVNLRGDIAATDSSDELEKAAGDVMDVRGRGTDAALMASATVIERQLASLFATLTLLIGVLLIYNVAALSALERRRDIEVMRTVGAGRRLLLGHALLEAAVIGVVGSALGILLGQALIGLLAGSGPEYMAAAFLVSPSVVTPAWLIFAAFASGVIASVVGGVLPTAMILRSRGISVDSNGADVGGESHARPSSGLRRVLRWTPLALLALGGTLAFALPSNSSPGIALMIVGGGLMMPAIVRRSTDAAIRRSPSPAGPVQLGIAELRAERGRATTLASICAMCFGALVLIGGSAANLERGMATLAAGMFDSADLWVSVAGEANNIGTEGFDATKLTSLERVDGVEALLPYRLTFVDLRGRRVLAIGYAPGSTRPADDTEFMSGDKSALASGLPRDGDVAVGQSLAVELGLDEGAHFDLPTPTGMKRVRYVTTITNYGWQAGAITMGGRTMSRLWGSDETTMLGVRLSNGADSDRVKQLLERSLDGGTTYRVESIAEGKARGRKNVKQGLVRMRQTEIAILLGAILAVTAGLLTAITHRRRRIASLRAVGMSSRQAVVALLSEVGFVLLIGSAVGLALGLAGQLLVLKTFSSVGYPIQFTPPLTPILIALVAMALIVATATVAAARFALGRSVVEDLAFE